MSTLQHPACRECAYAASWPASNPCIACYWTGGLTNHFTPPKQTAPKKEPKKRHRRRGRDSAGGKAPRP